MSFRSLPEPVNEHGEMATGHYLNFTPEYELFFERGYNPTPFTLFLQHFWWTSVGISAVYALMIFGLQRFMHERKPMRLTVLLTLWNVALQCSGKFVQEFDGILL